MTPPSELTTVEADAVRSALDSHPDWLSLAHTLDDLGKSMPSHALGTLANAFVYALVTPAHAARRATAGGPYASMFENDEGSFPPRPVDVGSDVRELWRSAAELVDHPIVTSRLNDLVYVAEGPKAHVAGRAAASGLLDLAKAASWTPLDRAVSFARALEIGRELNQPDFLATASEDGLRLVDELLTQEHAGPPMAVLRALGALKANNRPSAFEANVDRAIERYANAPAAEQVLEFAAEVASTPERRQALRRMQLNQLCANAQAAEGLAKVSLIQRALEFARRHSFSPEVAELLAEQQALPRDQLGFESSDVSIEIPTEEVRAEIDRVVGSASATDLFAALLNLGSLPPPGGSAQAIADEVTQREKDFPMLNLFGHQTFMPGSSSPTFIANDQASKRAVGQGQAWSLHANFWGSVLIGPMLSEAIEIHGGPADEALRDHFSTEIIGTERGERVARALKLYWEGLYDESAHMLVPRLESIVRDVARHQGLVVVKPAQEGRYAGFLSLNRIMEKLIDLIGEVPWLSYLQALLCDPLALNLRNEIAHGLVPRVHRGQSALLLQAACFLATLRLENPESP